MADLDALHATWGELPLEVRGLLDEVSGLTWCDELGPLLDGAHVISCLQSHEVVTMLVAEQHGATLMTVLNQIQCLLEDVIMYLGRWRRACSQDAPDVGRGTRTCSRSTRSSR